jgi:hypothetical protein
MSTGYATLEEAWGPCFKKKSKKSKKTRDRTDPSTCDTYSRHFSEAIKNNRANKLDNQFYVPSNDAASNFATYNQDDFRGNMTLQKRNFESQSEQAHSRNKLGMDQAHGGLDKGMGYYDPGGMEMELFDNSPVADADTQDMNDYSIGDAESEADYFDKLYKGHEFKNMESRNGLNLMKYRRTGSQELDMEDQDNVLEDQDVDIESNPSPIKPSTQLKAQDNDYIQYTGYQKDRYYMDFGLYLISGVLLIFILEQFVQIGMSLRQVRLESRNSQVISTSQPQYIMDHEPALSL